MSMLKCTRCGDDNLFVSTDYDGLACNSDRGEQSGFNTTISLNCPTCGCVYVIGRVKEHTDFALDTEANHFAYKGMKSRVFPKKE